jgi:hypothetical protein
MALPASGTLLVLASGSTDLVTLYSSRGLTQTLEPIGASNNSRRTINFGLVDLSFAASRKYKSSIKCRDQHPPALDGIFPGQVLTVSCVAELSYLTSGGTPAKTVVSGSSYVVGNYTFYRPQITMMVKAPPTISIEEYPGQSSWSLELEEV